MQSIIKLLISVYKFIYIYIIDIKYYKEPNQNLNPQIIIIVYKYISALKSVL